PENNLSLNLVCIENFESLVGYRASHSCLTKKRAGMMIACDIGRGHKNWADQPFHPPQGDRMKRLQHYTLILLTFFTFSYSAPAFSQGKNETRISILKLCYQFWQRSDFGRDYKATQKAMWLTRDSNGQFRSVELADSSQPSAPTWNDPPPTGVVAQF